MSSLRFVRKAYRRSVTRSACSYAGRPSVRLHASVDGIVCAAFSHLLLSELSGALGELLQQKI